jgi:hypothetical protein
VGHIAHLNVRDDCLPYKYRIGKVLPDLNQPTILCWHRRLLPLKLKIEAGQLQPFMNMVTPTRLIITMFIGIVDCQQVTIID